MSNNSKNKIIDSMVHILPEDFIIHKKDFMKIDLTFGELFQSPKSKISNIDELLNSMDKNNIDKAICCGFGWTSKKLAKLSNDYIIESYKKNPTKIIPFCSINPLWGNEGIEEIERCFEKGIKGVGELHPDYQGIINCQFSELKKFFNYCENQNLPVVIHASEPIGKYYPGKGTFTSKYIIELIEFFPKNTFIFSHLGGGTPFFALMKEFSNKFVNSYFDTAAFSYIYEKKIIEIIKDIIGIDKIIFSSDFPVISQNRIIQDIFSTNLSGSEKEAIFHENISKLLN
ncbi:MAG: hypothetical protein CL746_05215 [Chloroflexi bacterium]|nr:hypothetical protein [Chloroflexota bacterium]|tara:strand:+ start:4425 stop:5282 length:858 start_codon:yes stop_codon:yes gene_type:complete